MAIHQNIHLVTNDGGKGRRGRYGNIKIGQNEVLSDTQPLKVLRAKTGGFGRGELGVPSHPQSFALLGVSGLPGGQHQHQHTARGHCLMDRRLGTE